MVSSRRRFLLSAGIAGLGVAGLGAWRMWPEQGLLNSCLGELPPQLAGHPLLREAFDGLDPAQVWDAHVHLVGVGDGGNAGGAAFNDSHLSWRWPFSAAQRRVILNASCIAGDAPVDRAYVAGLRALADALPAGNKLLLLALDAWHDEDGRAVPERTHLFIANDYCMATASGAPQRFEWAASVHPYRSDALAELGRVKLLGARALKWLPSAQGIDPASPRCDSFYRELARLGLPLIAHAGAERAMPGEDRLGNPLKLRRALEHGVQVIVAHCASMGASPDLDRGSEQGTPVDNFSLFERMMNQPAYEGRLFGDLSALTQSARAGAPLQRVLERAREGGDWAKRLLNGSDYPLPGVMPLYSPRELADSGYLDPAKIAPLGLIRQHHPLLFDFVLKRHLRLGGTGLAASVFETRRFFAAGG